MENGNSPLHGSEVLSKLVAMSPTRKPVVGESSSLQGFAPHRRETSIWSPATNMIATAGAGWLGLPMTLFPLRADHELLDLVTPQAAVAVSLRGCGKRWLTSGIYCRQLYTAPRMIECFQAGSYFNRLRTIGDAGEIIHIEFPTATTARWMPDASRPFDLRTEHELFDDRVADVLNLLWLDAVSGSALGSLYTEGLTGALLGLLLDRHAAPETTSPRGTLDSVRRRRLIDLIATEIAGDLRIERLAEAIGVSPFHFGRIFKATFGQTPHGYVLERRIDEACVTLRREPNRSIAEIALAYGFSGQAHFTAAFRRRVGTTPTNWRNSR